MFGWLMTSGTAVFSRPISSAQLRLFEAIRDWPTDLGLLPTLDELARHLGVAKSTVSHHRQQLAVDGLVHFEKHKRRSTRVTTDPAVLATYGLWPRLGTASPTGARTTPTPHPRSRRAVLGGTRARQHSADVPATRGVPVWPVQPRPPRSLPLVGEIAAGRWRAFNRDESVLEVDNEFAGPGRYALRVSGDSLVDLGVFDGDHLIVDPDQSVHEGDLVAALRSQEGEDDMATVKVFVRDDDGQPLLVAGNWKYLPIPVDRSTVIWRVTTVIRRI
jgi:repressor LexA